MSPEAMEFGVIVIGAILIIGVVAQLAKMFLRHVEDRREQDRRDAWARRQERR